MRITGDEMHEAMGEEEEKDDDEFKTVEGSPVIQERKDDDNDDDPQGQKVAVGSSRSEEYKLEIANLNQERERLLNEVQEYERAFPNMKQEFSDKIQQLENTMGLMNTDFDFLRDIERSAKADYEQLTQEYESNLQEVENLRLNKHQTEIEIENIKRSYDNELERLGNNYSNAMQDNQNTITDLKSNYEEQIQNMQSQIQMKDNAEVGVQNLRQQLERERYMTNELKQRYSELERNMNREAGILGNQINNMKSEKDYEIENLKSQINQAAGERGIMESQYQKLLKEKSQLHELIQHKDHDIQ